MNKPQYLFTNLSSLKDNEELNFYAQMLQDLQEEALIWRVSYEYGGQRFYIPNKVTEKNLKAHPLAKYGTEFFTWLVDNYGGNTLTIPLGMNNTYKRTQTQAEILASRGFTYNQIARQLGIHYSSARRAKRRNSQKTQSDLFDS